MRISARIHFVLLFIGFTAQMFFPTTNSSIDEKKLTSNGAIIVTVDGLSFLYIIFSGDLTDEPNYLEAAFEQMNITGVTSADITAFEWTRDPSDTEQAIEGLKVDLAGIYAQAQAQNKKLIVAGHSWGTFLTYMALAERQDIYCDLYITLSSPIGSVYNSFCLGTDDLVYDYVRYRLFDLGYFDDPINVFSENIPNTGKWINVWAWGDTISGPIPNSDFNIKVDPLESICLLRVPDYHFQWHGFTKLLPGGYAFGYSNQQTIDEIRSIIEESIDSTPPTLGSWMSGTWSPGTKIYIGFSELLAENTINESTITVYGSASGPVSWNYQFDPDIFRLTLTPLHDFIAGETVTVNIMEGIEDLVGNGFDGDYDGQPGPSFQFTFNIADVAPSGPTNLVATAGSSTVINLSWDSNSTDEDGFIVERRIPPSSTWVEEGTVGPSVTTYQDWGLASGTSYCYRVKSFKGDQESDPSNEDCATPTNTSLPAAPSQLSAISVSGSQINLSWVDNASNEDSFRIERRIGWNGDWIWFATVGANTQTYQDTGLSVGSSYGYRVRAANSHGVSVFSNEAVATTSEILPAAPSNLSAQAVTDTRIWLTWKDNSNNENGFELERKTGSGGTWDLTGYAGRNETSFEDLVSSNTTYYFRVRAHNSVGYSGYSNEATATSCVAPPAPYSMDPYNGEDELPTTVILEWNGRPSDVSQYDIFLGTDANPPFLVSVDGVVEEYIVNGLAEGTQYYWKLVAHALCNPSLTTTSNTQIFFTLGGPSPVTLLKPVDGATGVATGVVLDWANMTDPGTWLYDLYCGTTNPPPKFEEMGTRTEKLMSGLLPNTKYYWNVVVKSAADPTLTNISPTWEFTTGTSSSTTLDLRAIKDAGLRGGSFGTRNYGGVAGGPAEQRLFACGNSDELFLDPGSAPTRGIVQFDLSSIPAGSTVTNATLTLYYQGGSSHTTALDVYFEPLVTAWGESTITWNNCPGINSTYRVIGVFPTSGYNPLQNNITTMVQAWVSGTISNNGILISIPAWETLTNKYSLFCQREDSGGSNTAAKLSVTYQSPCDPPSAPASPTPGNGATGQGHCVTLGWSAVANCQGYNVYIGSPTPVFHSMVTTNSATVCGLLAGTTYSWRVEAMADCDGSVVSTSPTWSFSTDACLEPFAASLSTPANGSSDQPLSVNLSWSAANGAGQYEVLCDVTNPPTQSLGVTANTTMTASGLTPQTTYFWRVKAYASCNPSLESSSSVWNFATGAPPPLAANFSYSPTSPNAGQQIQFTDTSMGSPTSWYWEFGDGTSANLQNPMHTYATGGIYTVRLTVANAFGSHFCNQNMTAIDYTLTTSVASGSGQVNPPGISRHNPGFQVTITASPDPCFVFEGWSGDVQGNTNPIQITINQNMTVSANFIEGQVIGDLDDECTIGALDLQILAAYLDGNIGEETINTILADCNEDGLVNAVDLVIMINYLAGNIPQIPVSEPTPTVRFSEGFEDSTVNQPPSGWTFNSAWGDSGLIRVVSTPVFEGANSLRVRGQTGWCQGVYRSGTFYQEDTTVTFHAYVPAGNSDGQCPGYFIYEGIAITFFSHGGTSYEARIGNPAYIITGLSTDCWYTFVLEIDWDTQKCILKQGAQATPPYNFTPDVGGGWWSALSLYGNNSSGTNTWYVDEIKITEANHSF